MITRGYFYFTQKKTTFFQEIQQVKVFIYVELKFSNTTIRYIRGF